MAWVSGCMRMVPSAIAMRDVYKRQGKALAAELADLGDGGLNGLQATAGGDDLDAALGQRCV